MHIKTLYSYVITEILVNVEQESRTLEMNNVQDGTWHGRGDTICIGSYGEASRFVELNPPDPVSTKSSEACGILKDVANHDHS